MKPTVSEDDLSPLNKSDLGNSPVSQDDYDSNALVNSSDDENVSKFTFTLPDEDEDDIAEPKEMEAESFFENVTEEITSDVDQISEVSEISDYSNLNYPEDVKPERGSFTQEVPKEEVLEQSLIAKETSSTRSEEGKTSSDRSTTLQANQPKDEEKSSPISKYSQSYNYDKGKKKSSPPKVLIIAIVAALVLGGGVAAFFLFGSSDDNKENTEQIVAENTTQPEDNAPAIEPEAIDEPEADASPVVEDAIKKEEKLPAANSTPQEVVKKEDPKKQEPVAAAEPEPSPAPIVAPKEAPVEPEPEKENIQYPYHTTIQYPTGNVYVGYINRAGKKDGKGTYTWTSGDRYEGDWKNDQATGSGTYYSREGWKYVGQFVNLKFHGQGEYYFANGKKRKGTWINGQMQK